MSMTTIVFVDECIHLEGIGRSVCRCRYRIHQVGVVSQFLLRRQHCGIGASRVFLLRVEQELAFLDPRSSILVDSEQ
jgi:hypothetical protein